MAIDRSQLPAGRHGIEPGVVIANQRRRLLDATAAVIAESGCGELMVSDVVERAKVSRRTFYELFVDKSDCVLATQRHAFAAIHDRIVVACASQGEWPERVERAVLAAIEFAGSNLDQARLALAPEYAHLEPELARNGLVTTSRLAAMLDQSARRSPDAHPADRLAAQGALGAAMSIAAPMLAAGDIDSLRALAPDLTRILLAPYLEREESERVAQGV